MSNEIFANSVRASRDLAGVFEYDGDTGYFYLYEPKGAKIIGALHVVSGVINFAFDNVSIRWDHSETKVGLFIKNVMWGSL
jgi:hypothetical protein